MSSGVAPVTPLNEQAQLPRAQQHAFDSTASIFSGYYEFALIVLFLGHEIGEVIAHKKGIPSANSQMLVNFGN
jgi:hypothetical protein